MSRSHFYSVVLVSVAACIASVHLNVAAQGVVTEKNPPRRLPPTGSQSTDIPAGVDTGSPTTANKMPLGTPVPPALVPDREDQNKRSAAARLASRPIDPARSSGAVAAGPAPLGAQTDSRDPGATLTRSQRGPSTAGRDTRGNCATGTARVDAPVALPQTGFLGGSAPPATASAVARGPSSRPC